MKQTFIFIFISIILFSCKKEATDASWLKIDKWVLTANPNAQNNTGELSHDLSQVFVNMDGKSLGVFELPAKIPIIGDGDHEFVILPGIINNGISETKKRYPFMEPYNGTINLIKNDTVSLNLPTQYYNSIKFLIEDFESPSMQLEVSTESTATIGRNDNPSILQWGNKYGEVLLTDSAASISFVTTFETVLPKLATEVYLEFDYMNSNSLLTSVLSYGNGNYYSDPYILLTSQDPNKAFWKHAYIDLKEIISFRQTTPINEAGFQIVLDEGETSTYFYIDNIKLVYP
ncbi:hypothetical protein [Brumimicrobium mesophilum]|uniref:hypothetical protein n=1 Tax=Brumimicrobium mesophilum TaxID=392717 RepID=UPI000D144E1F|nr:hypothetical protein [Brumimicrobium mesophilum]